MAFWIFPDTKLFSLIIEDYIRQDKSIKILVLHALIDSSNINDVSLSIFPNIFSSCAGCLDRIRKKIKFS